MFLESDKKLYYSGSTGGFGITVKGIADSLTLMLEGYETKGVVIKTDILQQLTLKELAYTTDKHTAQIISVTKDAGKTQKFWPKVDEDSYFSIIENEQVVTKKFPNTGFTMNVNKASYSNVKRYVLSQSEVPPDMVRVEELVNYFNLRYKVPTAKELFKTESQLTFCPWNKKSKLLFVTVNANKVDVENTPSANLVFLIDASASMDMPNRLPLIKAAFQAFTQNLRPSDIVSIVTYGGTVNIKLTAVSGADKQQIAQAIEQIRPDGDTPGEEGIKRAYEVAEKSFLKGGNNRVILATDGDFNEGGDISGRNIESLIQKKREAGIIMSCLGVGVNNFRDSKLERFAGIGKGNYTYLDNLKTAENFLLKELSPAFKPLAINATLDVHFNDNIVKDYRLLGFDNTRSVIKKGTDDLIGENITSGKSVLAIFEITTHINDSAKLAEKNESVAQLAINYEIPDKQIKKEIRYDCKTDLTGFVNIDKEYQFATAVAMTGLKLRKSAYLSRSNWDDILIIAKSSYNSNVYLQNEFVNIVSSLKDQNSKKRKKKNKG